MADVTEASPTNGSDAGSEAASCLPSRVGERRRPGRIEPVNRHIIPLLRGQGGGSLTVWHATSGEPVADWDAPEGVDEARRTVRGIIVGIPLGMAMWAAVALTARWALNF